MVNQPKHGSKWRSLGGITTTSITNMDGGAWIKIEYNVMVKILNF